MMHSFIRLIIFYEKSEQKGLFEEKNEPVGVCLRINARYLLEKEGFEFVLELLALVIGREVVDYPNTQRKLRRNDE
jgi:hypothetical protein